MVDVVSPRCTAEGCNLVATFGRKDSKFGRKRSKVSAKRACMYVCIHAGASAVEAQFVLSVLVAPAVDVVSNLHH
jgi:hypothetical protein